MDKVAELKYLETEMAGNKSLPLSQSNLVFGEGNVDCDVMFVGEAPGFHEDQQKRPFVGRGGQLLDDCIKSIGWKRADVYITNIVKRRPPENRDPLPEEIEAYKPYLAQQIEIIDPKIIVPLGRFAMNYFLPDAKITRDQGHAFKLPARHASGEAVADGDGRPAPEGGEARPPEDRPHFGGRLIVPMLHPAAALRGTEMMNLFRETFKKLPKIVSGDFAIETPALENETIAAKTVKPKKPPQPKLF